MYLTYSSIISAATTFSSPYAALLISLSLLITIFGCHYFLFSLCSLLISLLITIYKSLFTLLFPKCRLFSLVISLYSLVISLYSLVFSSFSFPKIQSYFFFLLFPFPVSQQISNLSSSVSKLPPLSL
jgi:hypothetical protein